MDATMFFANLVRYRTMEFVLLLQQEHSLPYLMHFQVIELLVSLALMECGH